MEKKLISIIIPVYNTEIYLRRCIESILCQTYSKLEIVLVDDGSSDSSGLICDQYAEKDKRIIVIHKLNQGVSAARNDALKIIKGEYVSFIDSDDYVDSQFIENLYSAFTNKGVDISICGLEKIGGINLKTGKVNVQYKDENIVLHSSGYINKDELWFHSIDSNFIGGYLVNKLFKTNLLNSKGLDTNLCIGEDMVYLSQYLLKVTSAYYIAKPLYKYQMNEASALNDIKDKEQIIKKIESNMKAAEIIQNITQNQTGNIRAYAAYRRIRVAMWSIYKMIVFGVWNKKIVKNIQNVVRQNYTNYKKVHYGSNAQNIAVKVFIISPKTVYILGRIFKLLFPEKLYYLSRN